MNTIDKYLENIKNTIAVENNSQRDLIIDLIKLFEYLCSSEGRTDENCKKVDHFFADDDDLDYNRIDEQIINVISNFNALHDTISAPETAHNSKSTPEQILEKLIELKANYLT